MSDITGDAITIHAAEKIEDAIDEGIEKFLNFVKQQG